MCNEKYISGITADLHPVQDGGVISSFQQGARRHGATDKALPVTHGGGTAGVDWGGPPVCVEGGTTGLQRGGVFPEFIGGVTTAVDRRKYHPCATKRCS